MAIYATAASNKSQPLNLDYVDAANMVNEMCGPSFANASIPDAGSGTGGGTKTSAASRSGSVDGAWKGWLGVLVGMAALVAVL